MRKVLQSLTPVPLLLLLAFVVHAQSGIINSTRYTSDWANAGVVGGLPDGSWTQCGSTIAAYTGSGATITNALASCGANHYVLLGPGTFNITSSGITFPTSGHVVLRGSGANSTFIVIGASASAGNCQLGSCIVAATSSDGTFINEPPPIIYGWTAGYAQASNSLTLSSVSGISTANPTMLFLEQCETGYTAASVTSACTGSATDNNQLFMCADLWTSTGVGCSNNGPGNQSTHRGQLEATYATNVAGSVVTIADPLVYPNWVSGQKPRVWIVQPISTVGVENISFDDSSNGTADIVQFFNAINYWVSGCRFANWGRWAVEQFQTEHGTIQNNYFYHTTGADSYGIRQEVGGHNLFQNNIITQVFAPIVLDGSSSADVIGYNYVINDNYQSDFMRASIFGHDVNGFELLEGNIVNAIDFGDGNHGTDNMPTLFRNFTLGWDSCANGQCGSSTFKDSNTSAIQALFGDRYANYVANVAGTPGFTSSYIDSTSNFFVGPAFELGGANIFPIDPLVSSTSLKWGNWDVHTGATRWCGNSSDTGWATTCTSTSEVPTGASTYPNSVPTIGDTGAGQGAFPSSFYFSSKPSFFGSNTWPAIGPDVSSGNVGQCSGTLNTAGHQSGMPATASGQCAPTSLTTPSWGGHVNANPAMACYLAMGGLPDGTGSELAFTSTACPYLTSGPALPTVTVSWNNVDQVIDGFGAADASEPGMSSAHQTFFFGTTGSNLGLSLLRMAVTNGNLWPGSCLTVSVSCAGTGASDAVALLANAPDGRVWATSWSPPAIYTTNGSTICQNGGGSGTLAAGHFGDYATWQTNFVKSLQTENGVTLYALSVDNEPSDCQTFDSILFNATQFDTYIKTNLGPTFAANSLTTLIALPEESPFSNLSSTAGTCMADASCKSFVGINTYHDYFSSNITGGVVNSTPNPFASAGKKYWETEVGCIQPAFSPNFCKNPAVWDPSITDALNWAAVIDQRMAIDSLNSWSYWALIANTNTDGQGLLRLDGTIAIRAYVLGQYARFIRPNFNRIDATHIPATNVTVSAYKGPSGQLAIVATNYNASIVSLNFCLSGAVVNTVTPWTTSASLSLAQQSVVTLSGGCFPYALPAQSITTFAGAQTAGTVSVTWAGSPSPLAFGSQSVGTQSASHTITLTNTGATAVAISLPITIVGANPSDFIFTTSSSPCPATLAVGTNCLINVALKPTAVGARSANVSITDSAVGSPHTVALTGTGVASGNGTVVQHAPFSCLPGVTCPGTMAPATSGDYFLIHFLDEAGINMPVAFSDGTNTYTKAVSCNLTTDLDTVGIFYAPILSNGTYTITMSDGGQNKSKRFLVAEVTGLSALDQTSCLDSTGTTVSSGNVTTLQANEFLFGGMGGSAPGGNTITAPAPFSILDTAAPGANVTADEAQNVSATGSYKATFTQTVSQESGVSLATFILTGAPPTITSLSATSGNIASTFTINGTGFGSTQGGSTATLNGVNLTMNSWSATAIGVTVPSGAATGSVVVTVSGTASNGITFTVTPHLTSLSVTSGPVATSVTMSGSGFAATQGSSTVTFNGAVCTPISWSSTSIVCSVPAAATTGNVVAVVGGNPSNGNAFTVTPFITSVSPTTGPVGTNVTISGTTFGASGGTVMFNGVTATCPSWSAGTIQCSVPATATTGNVVVTTAASQVSNGVSFTVTAPTGNPTISGVSPTRAITGVLITISGMNFGATQGTSTVTFSGVPCTISSWSATSVSCPVPVGITSGNIVVTVSSVASSGVAFAVIPFAFIEIVNGAVNNLTLQ